MCSALLLSPIPGSLAPSSRNERHDLPPDLGSVQSPTGLRSRFLQIELGLPPIWRYEAIHFLCRTAWRRKNPSRSERERISRAEREAVDPSQRCELALCCLSSFAATSIKVCASHLSLLPFQPPHPRACSSTPDSELANRLQVGQAR
jgi:hypothetical protein